jgi:indolepyruvate ferredoxin oxidoreductase alpha subunit
VRDYSRIVLPPSSYLHEKEKIEKRWPAAVKFIADNALNEIFEGEARDIGVVMQGGMYNTALRALELLGLADAFGESQVPLYVLNVTYPLIDEELKRFCAGRKAILIVEEGQPEFIEQAVNTILRRADIQTKVHGKDMLPMAGEYTGAVMRDGLRKFIAAYRPDMLAAAPAPVAPPSALQSGTLHNRPPSFCTGCPERPIFAAMKLVERELGAHHVSCDIGCHLFSILPPFNIGNTTMGYGLGGAGAAALSAKAQKRAISIVGDGGFWHNGLLSSVGNSVFNRSDNVTIIVDNGYSAATGGQDLLSSRHGSPIRETWNSIETAVRGVGVRWVRTLTRTYDVARMRDTLREALTTKEKGPKVIVAQSECMLNRQRREKPLKAAAVKAGKRVVRERYGVDAETCTGDHSCIRLSGCPSLTVAPHPDPLRRSPVTKVINSCVGCGLCGEVAHAAVLCPSFYRASIVQNPSWWDRTAGSLHSHAIGWLRGVLGLSGKGEVRT